MITFEDAPGRTGAKVCVLNMEAFSVYLSQNKTNNEMIKKLKQLIISQQNTLNHHIKEKKENVTASSECEIRTILCTSSARKLKIALFDEIINLDIHELFIGKFKETLLGLNISYESLIDKYLNNVGLVSKLNEILGVTNIEV